MYISGYNRTLALLFYLGGLRPKDMKVSPSPRAHRRFHKPSIQTILGLGNPTPPYELSAQLSTQVCPSSWVSAHPNNFFVIYSLKHLDTKKIKVNFTEKSTLYVLP